MANKDDEQAEASHPLIEAARTGTDADFVARFRASELFLVATPSADAPDPESMTEIEYAAWVEAGAQAETEDVTPLVVQTEAGQALPVFTTAVAAEVFIEQFMGFNTNAGPLVTLSVDGVDLAPCLEPGLGLLLDPGHAETRVKETALSALLASAS